MRVSVHSRLEHPPGLLHGTGRPQSYSYSLVSVFGLSFKQITELTWEMKTALVVNIATLIYIHRKKRYEFYQEVQEYYDEQMR